MISFLIEAIALLFLIVVLAGYIGTWLSNSFRQQQ
jgi:hypothetical protein